MQKQKRDITWRWSLDDDVNSVLGQFSTKDLGKLCSRLEFLLVVLGYIVDVDGYLVIVVVIRDRNRHRPEGEHVRVDIAERNSLLEFDCDLEVIDRLRWVNVDRERGRFAIDKTEKAQAVVVMVLRSMEMVLGV